MGRYADNLKMQAAKTTQTATDTTQTADITALKGLLTQGAADPSTKPSAKNLLYFNTTSQKLFVSTGTSASTDWKPVVGHTTG